MLIVAVGCYERGLLRSLPVGPTARRLADWWLAADASGRVFPRAGLSRLDVLVSQEGGCKLTNGAGQLVETARARADTIHAALRAWRDHSRTASLAVIHWMGHGEMLGESDGPIHLLACEDALKPADRLRLVNWTETLSDIRLTLSKPRLLIVMDTCRSPTTRLLGSHKRVFNEDIPPGRSCDGATFYACEEHELTHCVKPGLDVGWGFSDGGSMHSEAVLQALDRFGAGERDNSVGPAIYPDPVHAAVYERLGRWTRRVLGRGHPPPAPNIDLKGSPSVPLLKAPMPHSMVDLRVKGLGSVTDAACMIRDRAGKPLPTPTAVPGGWEADLPWGECEAEVHVGSLPPPGPHSTMRFHPRNAFERHTMPLAQAGGREMKP